jgi:hypothetical protein
MPRYVVSNLLGVVGAIAGGVAGFYTFKWLYHQGFYGMMIPGALLGLGAGLLARHRSLARGVACAIAALALALYTHWAVASTAPTFTDFLAQVKDLQPVMLLMIGLGTGIAFWLGKDAGYSRIPAPSGSGTRPPS